MGREISEGDAREGALNSVVQQWAQDDPNSAGAWIQSLTDSGTRTEALNSFISTISMSDPEVAVKWAETIQEDDARLAQFEIIAGNWMGMDETAAKNWISKSPLPKTVKDRLLNKREDAPPIVITPSPAQ